MLTEWPTASQEPHRAPCTWSCRLSVQQLWGCLLKVTRLHETFRAHLSLANISTALGERRMGGHGKRRKDQPVQEKTHSATRQRAFYNENTSRYKYNLHSSPALFLGFQVTSTGPRNSALRFRVVHFSVTYTSACWPMTDQGYFMQMRSMLLLLPHFIDKKTEAVLFTESAAKCQEKPPNPSVVDRRVQALNNDVRTWWLNKSLPARWCKVFLNVSHQTVVLLVLLNRKKKSPMH